MNKKIFTAMAVCVCLLACPAWSQEQSKTVPFVVDLELNKVYSDQDFEFTVQVVKIYKDSYPMGMFSGRPANSKMDPSFDGVLGIEITLKKGNRDTFSKLEKYIVNEKGEKNVKDDKMEMSGDRKYTVLFNVPMSSKKIKFGIGSLLLNLEKVLTK